MPRKADPTLKLTTLRLRHADIKQARKAARVRGIPYQHVIREWVRQGAERLRQ